METDCFFFIQITKINRTLTKKFVKRHEKQKQYANTETPAEEALNKEKTSSVGKDKIKDVLRYVFLEEGVCSADMSHK